MTTSSNRFISAFIAITLLYGQNGQAEAQADIKEIRNGSTGFVRVIELNTPAPGNAMAPGRLAGNKSNAIRKATEVLKLAHISAQVQRGAQTADQDRADEDFLVVPDNSTASTVRFQRHLQGVPVFGEEAIIYFDEQQNARQIVSNARAGRLKHDLETLLKESTVRDRAALAAKHDLGYAQARISRLRKYWVGDKDGLYGLQYQVDVQDAQRAAPPFIVGRRVGYRLWIDAQNAAVLRYYPLEIDARRREIYDMRNLDSGSAVLVKTETGNIAPYTGGDVVIEDLFRFLGASYDYFFDVFNRDSFDAAGTTVSGIAHLGRGYNNAYWCGCDDKYFAFGDGDGIRFLPFTRSLHVVGHEYTHAVTQYTAGLDYFALSGALNESVSDMFGKLIEASVQNNTVPDWLVGKEIVTAQFGAPALRDMKNPHQGAARYDQYDPFSTSSQPEHLDEVYLGSPDARGVHINSSLTNKMMQLLTEGGSHRGVTVQPLPLPDLTKILYHALTSYLTATSDLYTFVDGLRNACQVLSGSLQTVTGVCMNNVDNAGQAVGLRNDTLNFKVRLADLRQIAGNNNVALEAGEQFELMLDIFNKGTDLSSVTVNASTPGGILSISPLNYTFTGASSFGDRRKLILRGTVQQTPIAPIPITLSFTASGRNPQQLELTAVGFGVFDPQDYAAALHNVPVAFDLDGDGIKELIAIDGSKRALQIYHPITGLRTSTPIPATGPYSASFGAYQVAVDDFGQGDVRIISVEDVSRISTYNKQGLLLHTFTAPTSNNWNAWGNPAPMIADLEGDGSKEIIFATTEALYVDPSTGSVDSSRTDTARLYVLDKNLAVKPGWPQLSPDAGNHGYAGWDTAVGDVDGDGRKEIVVLTDYLLTVWDDQGRTKPGWPRSFINVPIAIPRLALADVDNDGKLEMFFGDINSSRVYAMRHDGATLPGFPLQLPAGVTADRVTPADINGDGQFELVLSSHLMGSFARGSITLGANTQPAVVTMSGQVLPGWPKNMAFFGALLADVSGDGQVDIVGGDGIGFLHAYNLLGEEQTGFPVNAANGWRNAVAGGVLDDFNADGKIDLAYTELNQNTFGASNGVGLIQFQKPLSSAALLWPSPNRNPQNTSAPPARRFAAMNYRGTTNNWGLTPMRLLTDNIWGVQVYISGAAGDRFKFDASNDWSRNFGDSNRDGIAGPGEADIYFNRPAGAYDIRFNERSLAYSITANSNRPPIANAGAATASVTVNQPIALDGSLSSDPEGRPLGCRWSYETATGEQLLGGQCVISHTFTEAGIYTVKLTVTDDQGLTATALKIVNVNPVGDWQRTVVFIYGETVVGQDMFIRGGIDHGYAQRVLGRTCTQTNMLCAIPIRHLNNRNATTRPWKVHDAYLDWYGPEPMQSAAAQGSALDWTTNLWPASWGPKKTVELDGYGETPLNTWGHHYWMLDVEMDCGKTVNGWFELKSFISNGPGWEGNIAQPGAPYTSINHFGQCGKLNRFQRGQNTVLIQSLP